MVVLARRVQPIARSLGEVFFIVFGLVRFVLFCLVLFCFVLLCYVMLCYVMLV